MESFDINKYLGLWYEIMRYPNAFEPSSCYNTTATYTLNEDNTIKVVNSTISMDGDNLVAHGIARNIYGEGFVDGRVPIGTLNVSFGNYSSEEPNYLVDNIFLNTSGDYVYSIVSNPTRDMLFVLSRVPTHNIRLETMIKLSEYISRHYDTNKIIHVPHYMLN
jgi:apolipoprotein D and lipocalin family protein